MNRAVSIIGRVETLIQQNASGFIGSPTLCHVTQPGRTRHMPFLANGFFCPVISVTSGSPQPRNITLDNSPGRVLINRENLNSIMVVRTMSNTISPGTGLRMKLAFYSGHLLSWYRIFFSSFNYVPVRR